MSVLKSTNFKHFSGNDCVIYKVSLKIHMLRDLDLLHCNKRKWICMDISLVHLLHYICTNIYIFQNIFTKAFSICLCRLEVPFCTSQSQKIIFFHIYAPYKLEVMPIHRLHHYSPHTSSLVLKIKNCVEFPCHIMRSMILDLPYTRNILTWPLNSIRRL
jgi:hypothetical protein